MISVKIHEHNLKILLTQENGLSELQGGDFKRSKWKYRARIDAVLLYYFLQELNLSEKFRKNFCSHFNADINTVEFILSPTELDTIDYNWNEKLSELVRERCELDHTLSWLSTLGGAFSALGDYFNTMAETAGKISFHQLQLAMRLGDPTIAARCKLYFGLSLIQRRKFRWSETIIRDEHRKALQNSVRDDKLINMCHGIWAKLKYEKQLYACNKQIGK